MVLLGAWFFNNLVDEKTLEDADDDAKGRAKQQSS
jgi:hypothetical protein